MRRARLDTELVRRGLARSREHAAELVNAARVTVSGQVAAKPATAVDPAAPLVILADAGDEHWASRGAHKLIGALDAFTAVRVEGARCLDAGASTGGFTDVLLRRGAAEIEAVDVGYGQLIWRLQSEDRVHIHDRTNVRTLTADDIGGPVDLVVSDLSFISLTLVLPALARCVHPSGDLVLMVKPQFEVGKDRLGAGGVVRDPGLRTGTVRTVVDAAAGLGFGLANAVASPLPGPSGNVEYFVHFRADAPRPGSTTGSAADPAADPTADERVDALIATAVREGPS